MEMTPERLEQVKAWAADERFQFAVKFVAGMSADELLSFKSIADKIMSNAATPPPTDTR